MSEPVDVEPGEGVPAYRVTTFREPRHRYALVIPVLNEGDRIRRQLAALDEAGVPADVYLADGGSTDGSTALAELSAAGVTALLVKTGPGKLSAQLRMGFHHVLGLPYDGVVTMDGNGKDGVEGVARIVAALESGLDFVQGSRFVRGGTAENTPLVRHLGVVLVHAPVTSLAARHRFTDTTNGFRGHSRRLLADPRVAIFRAVFDTYELLAYLPIQAARLGYRVGEVPVARRYPASGSTPTKIHGLSGNAQLLRVLAKAATHQYDPESGEGESRNPEFNPKGTPLRYRVRSALGKARQGVMSVLDEMRYAATLRLLERSLGRQQTTAVIVHVYFIETWPEIAARLRRLGRAPHDLIVSVPIRHVFWSRAVKADFPDVRIVAVPNRGRDVLPFIKIAGLLLKMDYNTVLKIHSKRSTSVEEQSGQAWRTLMLDCLLPPFAEVLRSILSRLAEPGVGLVGPRDVYFPLSTYFDWNRQQLCDVLEQALGVDRAKAVMDEPSHFGFFAGSMFWARLESIAPLFELRAWDFEPERGQLAGTKAHAVERAFTLVSLMRGYENLEISGEVLRARPPRASEELPTWFPPPVA